LPELISMLKARNFQFVQIKDLIGQSDATSIPVTDDGWVPVAQVGFESLSLEQKLLLIVVWTCIFITAARLIILLICAVLGRRSPPIPNGAFHNVSVIVPAYNEAKVIARTVDFILKSDYQNLREIIVVDDGSSDGTAAVVENAFANDSRVRVFRKPNGGKSAALNFGIANARSEILVMLDADTLLHPSAIRMLARHFDDPGIGAVAGNAKVGNRVNLVTKLQALEYITSQNLERAGLAQLDAITVVPGAVGAWRREAILRAGGLGPATLAEDCDLTLSLHRAGYRIAHEMAAIGWTEAPQTWRSFMRQRFRWIYGTLQATFRHADVMFRPRYGAFAYFSLPSILLFTLILPLISPVMDGMLVIAVMTGIVDIFMHPKGYSLESVIWALGAYLFVFFVDLIVAWLAFILEPSENRWLMWYLPIQRICYRQVLYVVILRAILSSLRGDAQGWNKLARFGSSLSDRV
jgi:peptidoglycan-N-acetylglucosamine deacetylase